MSKEVRLIPENRDSCVPDSLRDPSEIRTHVIECKDNAEATQCIDITLSEMADTMEKLGVNIKGKGNGSVKWEDN